MARRLAGRDRSATASSASSSSASSSASRTSATSARRSAIPSARSRRSTSPAPTARDRSPRWSTRALRAAGYRTGRYTSPHLVRSRRALRHRRPSGRAGRRSIARSPRCTAPVDARCVAHGELASQPDVLRGHDRGRVRAVPPRARRGRGARGRPRRPARRHQRRHADASPPSRRSTSITRRTSAHAGGDRRREGRHHQAGRAGRRRDRSPARRCDDRRETRRRRAAPLHRRRASVPSHGARDGRRPARGHGSTTPRSAYGRRDAGLRGAHQVDNAVVAVVAARSSSRRRGVAVGTPTRSSRAWPRRAWPGRLELHRLSASARVLLDAAHNPAGARALAATCARRIRGAAARVRRHARQGHRCRCSRRSRRARGRSSSRARPWTRARAIRADLAAIARARAVPPERVDRRARRRPRARASRGARPRDRRGGIALSRRRRPCAPRRRWIADARRVAGRGIGVVSSVAVHACRRRVARSMRRSCCWRAASLCVHAGGRAQRCSATASRSRQWTIEQLGDGSHQAHRPGARSTAATESMSSPTRSRSSPTPTASSPPATSSSPAAEPHRGRRLEFNTRTQARARSTTRSGTATLQEPSNAGAHAGASASSAVRHYGQEPDVYFYGETIEKVGPKKYRITNGGFTTCVQPTPRWELTSGTVT